MRTRTDEQDSERAFAALIRKFTRIQYLVEQRAFADVIEKAPVGICITNKSYLYEYVNEAYCRIYGYAPEELLGRPFTMVVPEDDRRELTDLHDRFMHQEYELAGEWHVVAKDGRPLTILANAVYVLDEKRQPKKITFVLDMTEKAKAQADLDAARSELEAKAARLEDFRTAVSASVTPALESALAVLRSGAPSGSDHACDDAVERLTSALGELRALLAR